MNQDEAQHYDELERQRKLIADLGELQLGLPATPEMLDNFALELGLTNEWNEVKLYKTRKLV